MQPSVMSRPETYLELVSGIQLQLLTMLRRSVIWPMWTYRLIFVDGVLDTAGVLGHPWGVKYGDTGHAQDRRRQGEVDTGWRNLKPQTKNDENKKKWEITILMSLLLDP